MDALLILREGDEPWEGVSQTGGHRVIGDLRAVLPLV
jgi:hypothetical protein